MTRILEEQCSHPHIRSPFIVRSSIVGSYPKRFRLLQLDVFPSHLHRFQPNLSPKKDYPVGDASLPQVPCTWWRASCLRDGGQKLGLGVDEWDRWGRKVHRGGLCWGKHALGGVSWLTFDVKHVYLWSHMMFVWDRLNKDCIMAVESIRAPEFRAQKGLNKGRWK